MPHCLIEYSTSLGQTLSPDDLLESVFNAVSASDLFDASNVSARLYPHAIFREGGGKKHFVHVSIKLYAGRTDTDKAALTQSVSHAIQALGVTDALISCECVDTHKASMTRDFV